jgi:hypothetical protein
VVRNQQQEQPEGDAERREHHESHAAATKAPGPTAITPALRPPSGMAATSTSPSRYTSALEHSAQIVDEGHAPIAGRGSCISTDSITRRTSGAAPRSVACVRGCRINPATRGSAVGISNEGLHSQQNATAEAGVAGKFAAVVGDFATAGPLPDSLVKKQKFRAPLLLVVLGRSDGRAGEDCCFTLGMRERHESEPRLPRPFQTSVLPELALRTRTQGPQTAGQPTQVAQSSTGARGPAGADTAIETGAEARFPTASLRAAHGRTVAGHVDASIGRAYEFARAAGCLTTPRRPS